MGYAETAYLQADLWISSGEKGSKDIYVRYFAKKAKVAAESLTPVSAISNILIILYINLLLFMSRRLSTGQNSYGVCPGA